MIPYTVCITTFDARFEHFKNVVRKVKQQREDIEFIVLANGNTKQQFNEPYRKALMEFIAPLRNTFPVVFPEFRGLAKIWNTGCQLATNDHVLIIQDDIDFDQDFFDQFERVLESMSKDCFSINNNFCGLHVNKKVLDKLNWFDERFLSLGSEDLFFIECYLAHMKYPMPSVEIPSYHNRFELDWQKDLVETEVRMVNQNHNGARYSPFNYEVFKYIMTGRNIFDRPEYPPYVSQYPHEKFFQEFKDSY